MRNQITVPRRVHRGTAVANSALLAGSWGSVRPRTRNGRQNLLNTIICKALAYAWLSKSHTENRRKNHPKHSRLGILWEVLSDLVCQDTSLNIFFISLKVTFLFPLFFLY